jgi:hypothetical protein
VAGKFAIGSKSPGAGSAVQQAAAALSSYLAAAVRRSQELPIQAWAAGQELPFTMPHSGVGLFARLTFRGTLTRTEGATVGTVTASQFYPFNLIKLQYVDYQGITRMKVNGYELNELQQAKAFAFNPAYTLIPPGASPGYAYSDTIFANSVPAGTASSQTTSACNFGLVIPISLGRWSVRGSHPFTIPNSEDTLTVTCLETLYSTTNSGPELPFVTTGGSELSISGNFDCAYYYYDTPAGTPLPTKEFSVIHELYSVKDTTNLSAGQQKLFTLQTGRTYYRVLANLCLNAEPDTVDIDQLSFLVDGGTPTLNENLASYLDRIRDESGQDFPPGMIFYDFTRKPWTPDNYGSLQLGVELSSGADVGSVAYLRVLRETLYTANANLQSIG